QAEIALGNDFPARGIPEDRPVGADQDAGPAAHAALRVTHDGAGGRIPVHGPGDAGLGTVRVLTVPALEGKGDGAGFLHPHPGGGWRGVTLENLNQIVRVRAVGCGTVDFAKVTADTIFVPRQDSFHRIFPLYSPAALTPRMLSSFSVSPTPRSMRRLPLKLSMALIPMPPSISLISCFQARS